MKKTALVTLVTILTIFCTLLNAEFFDPKAEDEILNCIKATEFCKKVIQYRFNNHNYLIRIVHNPKHENLWGYGFSAPQSWAFAVMSDLPFELANRISHFVSDLQYKKNDLYVDLSGLNRISPAVFASLHPVVLAEKIDDPKVDSMVQEAFSSNEFVNRCFIYRLEDQYYQVRVVHNPEGRTFSISKKFRRHPADLLNTYSSSWSYKYAIITDKEVPQDLIDHLSSLTNASWWDWHFNFQVSNGTFLEYIEREYAGNIIYTTTYSIDSWFNISEEFH